MNTNILITGGSGLVGSRLSKILQENGYGVVHLSRNPKKSEYPTYYWNPDRHEIDINCLKGISCIINLAGAGVADSRWTDSYKKEILDSRIFSTQLLAKTLSENKHEVHLIINASAVGIYGNNCPQATFESAPAASNFLAQVCNSWEEEALKMSSENMRVAIFRIGLVLSEKGGFLKAIAAPARLGFATWFANGEMINPWIHIDDLCQMFLFAIKNATIEGVYNAVAPNPETNKRLVQLCAQTLNRPSFLPGVPAFVLKAIMGEMASMLLANQFISSKKIQDAGFQFLFDDAKSAMKNLLNKNNSSFRIP